MSLDHALAGFTLYEPADENAIEAAKARLGISLPADYIEFLRRSNGAMNAGRGDPGLVVLHPVEDAHMWQGRLRIGYDGG